MSQILSNLIVLELQKSNPNPAFAEQQKQLADAISNALQTYLNTPGNITLYTPPTGLVPVPLQTVGAPVGIIGPKILIKAK